MKRINLTLALMLLGYFVSAKEIRVPTDYNTIQKAINASSEGDIIRIGSGNYHEFLTISKNISLIGDKRVYIIGANSTSTEKGALVSIETSGKVSIKNIWLRGGEKSSSIHEKKTGNRYMGSATRGIYAKCESLELENVRFRSFSVDVIKMEEGKLEATDLLFQFDERIDPQAKNMFRLKNVTSVTINSSSWGNLLSEAFMTVDSPSGSLKTTVTLNACPNRSALKINGSKSDYQLIRNAAQTITDTGNANELSGNDDEGVSNLAPIPMEDPSESGDGTETDEVDDNENIAALAPIPVEDPEESMASDEPQYFEINDRQLLSKQGEQIVGQFQFESGATVINSSQENGLIAIQYSVNGANKIATFDSKTNFIGEFTLGEDVEIQSFTVSNHYVTLNYKKQGKNYLCVFDDKMALKGYQDFTAWPLVNWVMSSEFLAIHYKDNAGNNLVGTYSYEMKFIASYSFDKSKFRVYGHKVDGNQVIVKYKAGTQMYIGKFDKNMKFLSETKR